MVTYLVTYEGTEADRFDRAHFEDVHLPLVRSQLTQHGLLSIEGYYPARKGTGVVAANVFSFRDEQAMQTAFASPEFVAVVEDVKNYTDLAPNAHKVEWTE